MINRYYRNPQEIDFQLSAPPIRDFVRALDAAQKSYDTNFDTLSTLKNRYVDSLRQDRAEANSIQQSYETRINDMVNSVGGDYSKLNDQVRSLKADMMKEYSPGGKAYAIMMNKKQYDTEIARQKQRLGKGEVTEQQLQLLDKYVQDNYKGIGSIDPLTGSYNQLSMPDLAEYVDPTKDLRDTFSKAPKRKVRRVVPQSDGKGHIIYQTVETEEVDPNQLQSSGYAQLASNRKYLNYLSNLAQLSGKTPQETQAFLNDSATNLVKGLVPEYSGRFSDIQETDVKTDDIAKLSLQYQNDVKLEGVKQRNREKLARLKNELENAPTPMNSDNIQLLTVANNATGLYSPVDPSKQELEVSKQVPGANPFGSYAGARIPTSDTTIKIKQKISIADVLSTPEKFPQVNTELLRSIEREHPELTAQQKWTLYNDGLQRDDYGSGVYINAYDTPEAMKRDADVAITKMGTGQADLMYVDGKTGKVVEVPAARQKKLFEQIWDPKKRSAQVSVLGKTLSQTGNVPVGSAFASPVEGETGYYILPELEERMRNYNNTTRVKAFGFINQNKSQGDAFDVYDAANKTRHQLMGIKTYETDPSTGSLIPKVRFAPVAGYKDNKPIPATKNVDGKDIPDYLQSVNEFGEPYDLTPAHIELMIRPEIRYPVNKRSGDKESNTLIED